MSAVKEWLHQYIDSQDEVSLLSLYKGLQEQNVIGFDSNNKPITVSTLSNDIQKATTRIDNGYFIAQNEVKKRLGIS